MVNIYWTEGNVLTYRVYMTGTHTFTLEGKRVRIWGFATRADQPVHKYQARRSRCGELHQGKVQYGIEKACDMVKLDGTIWLERPEVIYLEGMRLLRTPDQGTDYYLFLDSEVMFHDGDEYVHARIHDGGVRWCYYYPNSRVGPDCDVSLRQYYNYQLTSWYEDYYTISIQGYAPVQDRTEDRTGVFWKYGAEGVYKHLELYKGTREDPKKYTDFEYYVRNNRRPDEVNPPRRVVTAPLAERHTLSAALTELRRTIRHLWWSHPQTDVDWELLCNNAVDGLKLVNANMIAYFAEFSEFGGEIKAGLDVLANPKSIKAWASLYLSIQYGTRLTVADTLEVKEKMQKEYAKLLPQESKAALNDPRVTSAIEHGNEMIDYCKHHSLISRPSAVRARFNDVAEGAINSYATYKLCYSPIPQGLDFIWSMLDRMGLMPTGSRLYDLIPYSFVFNWFVNIQQAIEGWDNQIRVRRYPIISECKSERVEWPETVLGQQLTAVWYHRDVAPNMTVRPNVIDVESLTAGKHIGEIVALIVQHL